MLKTTICLTFLLLIFACRSEEEPNVQKGRELIEKYKEELVIAEQILANLITARGIPLPNGTPKISLETSKFSKSPAAAALKTNELQLHPRTLEVCRAFGDDFEDALAAILGHELVHFYQQRNCAFTHEPTRGDSIEHEADWQGLFNSYLAGYKIKGEGRATLQSHLIDSIYAKFPLGENKRYPSIAERKVMVAKAAAKRNELIGLYETANYAMLRGSFLVAVGIYDYLLTQLDAKELHHNIAIAYASMYKQLNGDDFTYPFELNTDFRLYAALRAVDLGIGQSEVRNQALAHFEKSTTDKDERLIFETTLKVIEGDFPAAKTRLSQVVGKGDEKFLGITNTIKTKELGGKASPTKNKQRKPTETCGFAPTFLSDYHPTKALSEDLFVLVDSSGIFAVRYRDKRFVAQFYAPMCLEDEAIAADYSVRHSKGEFHVFVGDGLVYKRLDGKVVQGAWIFPGFRQ